MANPEHLAKLKEGVEAWNKWREENRAIKHPDLSGTDFTGMSLEGINLRGANLTDANFNRCDLDNANLWSANFANSNFSGVSLVYANMIKSNSYNTKWNVANFTNANLKSAIFNKSELENTDFESSNLHGAFFIATSLKGASFSNTRLVGTDFTNSNLNAANFQNSILERVNFTGANLSRTNLSGSILNEVTLNRALLLGTNISNSQILNSRIYGISVWDVKNEGLIQKDLIISKDGEQLITVDNIEIAQFIYLLLNNQNFRDVIESITSKAVLILGRFTDNRKKVLDAIRDDLRSRNFLPILFDFEKPATRDLTETISILAKLSRFVIADLTDAKSIPQELSHIIPFMPNLPVIPIILQGQREYAMFEHWKPYPWVLPIYEYTDEAHLILTLSNGVIEPAERKVQEIRNR